jgi:hypothetical protein
LAEAAVVSQESLDATLAQATARAKFRRNGLGQWTTLYDQEAADGSRTGFFCAVASTEYRATALRRSSWDLSIGHGQPGFMQSFGDGVTETTYLRYGSDSSVEPLVINRDFFGIRPRYNELIEEFRHLHNLYDSGDGRLFQIGDDGSEVVAAEVTPERVRVLTRLLRSFQAVRQVDLLLFIDSTQYAEAHSDVPDVDEEETEDLLCASFYVRHLDGRLFSRYLGKRVLPPPPMTESGIAPFDQPDDHYPEFIIGVDAAGGPVRYRCDGDQLSNYFGANPGAPHYLTPVFFSREVLRKYYERPERYSVDDGYLRCAGLWSLRLDNDHADHVMVFLGDLGSDLPTGPERDYWRSFNILPPVPEMSETAYRRNFLAQFAGPTSPDLLFRYRYESFAASWKSQFGWELFRAPGDGDEHLLQRVRVPLTNSDPEFEEQLLLVARLLVDFLNDAELKRQTAASSHGLKSIGKLEAWLKQEGYRQVSRDIELLRGLQSLRSKGAAHRKGSGYASELTALVGTGTRQDAIRQLLDRALTMLADLSEHFHLVSGTTGPDED